MKKENEKKIKVVKVNGDRNGVSLLNEIEFLEWLGYEVKLDWSKVSDDDYERMNCVWYIGKEGGLKCV